MNVISSAVTSLRSHHGTGPIPSGEHPRIVAETAGDLVFWISHHSAPAYGPSLPVGSRLRSTRPETPS